MLKKSKQISWERREILRWNKKAFFIIFEGLPLKQIFFFFLEDESPTLKIWSCKITSCLEIDELTDSQSALWYNLTLMECGVDLSMFVEKSNRMAEWSEERSLFKGRFWILLKIAGEEIT